MVKETTGGQSGNIAGKDGGALERRVRNYTAIDRRALAYLSANGLNFRGQAFVFAPACKALPAGASSQRLISRPTARWHGRR